MYHFQFLFVKTTFSRLFCNVNSFYQRVFFLVNLVTNSFRISFSRRLNMSTSNLMMFHITTHIILPNIIYFILTYIWCSVHNVQEVTPSLAHPLLIPTKNPSVYIQKLIDELDSSFAKQISPLMVYIFACYHTILERIYWIIFVNDSYFA